MRAMEIKGVGIRFNLISPFQAANLNSQCKPVRATSVTSISRLNLSYLPRIRSDTWDWLIPRT